MKKLVIGCMLLTLGAGLSFANQNKQMHVSDYWDTVRSGEAGSYSDYVGKKSGGGSGSGVGTGYNPLVNTKPNPHKPAVPYEGTKDEDEKRAGSFPAQPNKPSEPKEKSYERPKKPSQTKLTKKDRI